MDSSTLVLGLRVILSLACVLGLLWFAARRLQGTGAVRRQKAAAMTVVTRQQLGGKAGLALVEVEGRRLLLGVSEHGVTLLTEIATANPAAAPVVERVELDPADLAELAAMTDVSALDDDAQVPTRDLVAAQTAPSRQARPARGTRMPRTTPVLSTPAARMPAVPKPRSPLEGSILSATTWRQAVAAAQDRTIRR